MDYFYLRESRVFVRRPRTTTSPHENSGWQVRFFPVGGCEPKKIWCLSDASLGNWQGGEDNYFI